MNKDKKILIVGAGPSGLSAAIFLSELGYHPRIIDKKTKISDFSKALAVNPMSLTLFENLGITQRFLENGRKMQALNFWKGDKHVFQNNFQSVKHKYPFMLVQTQKDSEEILLDELKKRNIEVEYGTECTDFQKNEKGYTVSIKGEASTDYDYFIGADGGHSIIRKSLGIEMKGYRYDEEWELYDVELDINIPPDEGHIRVFPEGGMIMIRLYDNYWRIAGNLPSILNFLPKNTKIGEVIWESKFRIHHKVAKSLVNDNVVLIGDAAHLHSPVGARGMNLGIQDAYLVSQLIHKGTLASYNKERLAFLENTVNRINIMTMGVAGNTIPSRIFRKNINLISVIFPLVMPTARKFIMGLN